MSREPRRARRLDLEPGSRTRRTLGLAIAFAGFGFLVVTTYQVEVSGSRETAVFTPFGIVAIVLMVLGVVLRQLPRKR